MDFKTFALVADNHGDQIHPATEKKFFRWLEDFKPNIRVHLGDNWNFDALRRGASESDKTVDLKRDIAAGKKFLSKYFAPDATNIFLRGNHDERLWKLQKDPCNAVARGYAEKIVEELEEHIAGLNAKMLPYDSEKGVYRLGKLTCVHGYAHGMGASRTHARVYGNCVFGHVHRFDACGEASLGRRYAQSIGCLARHDMAYCADKAYRLGWHHGWAYGVLYSNGNYEIKEAKIGQDGRVAVATAFTVY
ncbi:MAG: hypothetical protein EBR82_21535 [Caulobacteraceae bacterium]|nr:hypothetical protein [Caulobacteraceae bacterium]